MENNYPRTNQRNNHRGTQKYIFTIENSKFGRNIKYNFWVNECLSVTEADSEADRTATREVKVSLKILQILK